MQTKLDCKFRLFPIGYALDYQAQFQLSPGKSSEILDFCLRKLLYFGTEAAELRNLKGRDAVSINQSVKADVPRALGEEILCAYGEVLSGDQNYPFRIDLLSIFTRFESQHIIHSLKFLKSGEFLDCFDFKNLARTIPIRLFGFRLGLEFFKSHYLTSLLGFIPVVSQYLYLECDGLQFSLNIKAEGVTNKHEIPIRDKQVWQILQAGLFKTLGFDLEGDFFEHLAKRN